MISKAKPFLLFPFILCFVFVSCPNDTEGTLSNPKVMIVHANLGTMTEAGSDWQSLLTYIEINGKYVALDLSACTMDGTDFNPVPAVAAGKDKIVKITLPDTATAIAANSIIWGSIFNHFNNLRTVRGKNIVSIGNFAFKGITSLAEIDLPEGLTTIGRYAFHECLSLNQIDLPESVTFIRDFAFADCANLEQITLSAGTIIEDENPFRGCKRLKFKLTGSGSLSVFDDGRALVQHNTELVTYPSANGSITLPEGITVIGIEAFANCHDLSQITLPQSLINIEGSAFDNCIGLTQITLPENITDISGNAFDYCSKLVRINSLAVNPPMMKYTMVIRNNIQHIKVPSDSVDAYKAADGWSEYANIISAID